ncbi:MAG: cadmium resistance transporter [Treponema sp.]|nr:cadmium resistance transporter [Treponema sp.]
MVAVVFATLITFIATEIDGFIMLFLLACKSDTVSERTALVLGKYASLFLLVAVCYVWTPVLNIVNNNVLGLSGFVAILTGILFPFVYDKKIPFVWFILVFVQTVVLALGNGTDNIEIYLPLFDSLSHSEFIVMVCVLFVLQTLCLWGAVQLSLSKNVQLYVRDFAKTIIPIAFVILGTYILLKNGTIPWLSGLLRHRP